jgi:hypothetical protein
MRLIAAVFVVAFAAGPVTASAQERSYGVKGGVTFATISVDPSPEPSYGLHPGIAVGGFFTWPIGSRLALQPELLFNQKGTSVDEEFADATTRIDYLEAPILVRYALSSGARPFFLFGGASIAFKLRAESRSTVGGTTIETDETDQVEDLDYGLVVGVGKEFGRYVLDGRYTHGLKDLDPFFEEAKIKNRAITVLFGMRF